MQHDNALLNICIIGLYLKKNTTVAPNSSCELSTSFSAERRCPKNQLFYLKEVNAELGGPFDTVTFVNVTLEQCKQMCIEGKTVFCRSLEYDLRTRVCVLSDEDSVSKRPEMRASTSNDNVYFELQCFDGGKEP